VLGECILQELLKSPQALLHGEVIETLLDLKQPLGHLSEDERRSMRKAALVADDGLPAAIEEIAFSSDRPFSSRRLHTLRVSLAIVSRELNASPDDWDVVQVAWDQQEVGLLPRLVELVADVASDLREHFALATPDRMKQSLVDQLFSTAEEFLRIINRLATAFSFDGHSLRRATFAIAEIFVCSDAADMLYTPESAACAAAQRARQICLEALHQFSQPHLSTIPHGAEIVMRTLLLHSTQFNGFDPAYHLLQIVSLLDHIIPGLDISLSEEVKHYWLSNVLPKVYADLRTFFCILDPENQAHIVRRLARLDEGVTGIAEWLLLEDVKALSRKLGIASVAANAETDLARRTVTLHQIYLHIRCLMSLLKPMSSSEWCIQTIATNTELSKYLNVSLMSLVDGNFVSPFIRFLATTLIPHIGRFSDEDLKFAILITFLRASRDDPLAALAEASLAEALKTISPGSTVKLVLLQELGTFLQICARHNGILPESSCAALVAVLEWLMEQADHSLRKVPVIRSDDLSNLYQKIQTVQPTWNSETVKQGIIADEDTPVEEVGPTLELPEKLSLSVDDIRKLSVPEEIEIPSTPKRNNRPDLLASIISSPTAFSRATTGLTKTYAKNDFRDLRQAGASRQNTSRLPSMHGAFTRHVWYLSLSDLLYSSRRRYQWSLGLKVH
jgi:hypothetical protein